MEKAIKKEFVGKVVSASNNKTISVLVETSVIEIKPSVHLWGWGTVILHILSISNLCKIGYILYNPKAINKKDY